MHFLKVKANFSKRSDVEFLCRFIIGSYEFLVIFFVDTSSMMGQRQLKQ